MGEAEQASSFKQTGIRKWILTGLLIRLIVMPITTHGDLLSIYHRAHLLLDGSNVKGLGPSFFNVIHAGFLWVFRPLLPYSSMWGDTKAKTLLAFDWLAFVNQTAVFRELFIFKLPYLLFEILVIWMLIKLTEPERVEKVVAFWVLNPIVIFSAYIFGRFDMITVFLLLSSLYFAKLGMKNRSLLMLGLSALLRIYPIVLVLPFALILESDFKKRVRLGLVGLFPLLASMAVGWAQGQIGIIRGIAPMGHLAYPLAMKFFLGLNDRLYIFVLIYSLILLFLYIEPQIGFKNLVQYSFYVLALFFATSFFHPHYLIWIVPFMAFYFDIPKFQSVYRLLLVGWVIYTFQWGRDLAGSLLAPLSPAFFWSTLSPSEWINHYYPSVQIIGMGRSFFSATCLALVYLVWKKHKETEKPKEVSEESPGEVVYETTS